MSSGSKSVFVAGGMYFALILGIGAIGFRADMSNQANAEGPVQRLSSDVPIDATDNPVPVATKVPVPLNENQSGSGGTVQSKKPEKTAITKRPGWNVQRRSADEWFIEKELGEISEVSFIETPLEDALRDIENAHNIKFWIDKQSLQEQGLDIGVSVSLQMVGKPLKSALNLLFEPLNLDYIIRDDVIVVTADFKAFETRVYNVERLDTLGTDELEEMIYATIAPEAWNERLKKATFSNPDLKPATSLPAGIPGGSPAFVSNSRQSPGSKTASGIGASTHDGGSIRTTKSMLVIRQTRRIHERIVDLLDQLEDSTDTNASHQKTQLPRTEASNPRRCPATCGIVSRI